MKPNNKLLTRVTRASLAYFVLSVIFSLASAGESFPNPQQVIEKTSQELKNNLYKDEYQQNFRKANQFVEQVINPHADFNRVSALVLGKYWKSANNDQKNRFKQEFKTLLIRVYTRAFIQYADWSIRFKPMRIRSGDRKVVVRSEVLQPGKQPIAVDYRMVFSRKKWKVYDIIIEGLSIVTNYRSNFRNDVANTGSLETVIEKIAKHNEERLSQSD